MAAPSSASPRAALGLLLSLLGAGCFHVVARRLDPRSEVLPGPRSTPTLAHAELAAPAPQPFSSALQANDTGLADAGLHGLGQEIVRFVFVVAAGAPIWGEHYDDAAMDGLLPLLQIRGVPEASGVYEPVIRGVPEASGVYEPVPIDDGKLPTWQLRRGGGTWRLRPDCTSDERCLVRLERSSGLDSAQVAPVSCRRIAAPVGANLASELQVLTMRGGDDQVQDDQEIPDAPGDEPRAFWLRRGGQRRWPARLQVTVEQDPFTVSGVYIRSEAHIVNDRPVYFKAVPGFRCLSPLEVARSQQDCPFEAWLIYSKDRWNLVHQQSPAVFGKIRDLEGVVPQPSGESHEAVLHFAPVEAGSVQQAPHEVEWSAQGSNVIIRAVDEVREELLRSGRVQRADAARGEAGNFHEIIAPVRRWWGASGMDDGSGGRGMPMELTEICME